MKKIRLKKKVKKFLIIIAISIIILIFGINKINSYIKEKNYEKTYEYKLINFGYKKEDAIKLDKKFKDKEKDYILDNKISDIYLELIKDDYFIYDNFYNYIDYFKNNKDKSIRDIIEIVNVHRDKEYYSTDYKTDTSKGELMLVNKYYKLDKEYVPDNLVTVSLSYSWGELGSQKVTKDTYDAFIKLWEASHENGYFLMVSSSYRDYANQEKVYEQYKKSNGEEYADKIAARPGHSEHQTGLSLDIFEKGTSQSTFEETESYNWLKENAHKYGFIERYSKDKINITGYKFESWHFRYVGVESATYIYEHNITFDEYYELFVK